jgi:lipoate-protein ligase A
MAVDAALLHSHAGAGAPPTLRFYQWAQPTLSLGAGQQLPLWLSLARLNSLGVALVRRPTGGRAVLHGRDLTYCLVAGAKDGFQPSVTAVYQRLCRGLQAGLARLGLAASPGASPSLAPRHFHCFAGTAHGDLTWQGKKFLGSAQVWLGPSFLQHGAVLLAPQDHLWQQIMAASDREPPAPMTSLAEILGAPVSPAALQAALRQGFQEELGLIFEPGELTSWERDRVNQELTAGQLSNRNP